MGTSRVFAVANEEGDRVTTLELFFDLAFVFAFTQLSRLMAQQHDALGVFQALVILALLWWSWSSYGWLSNLAHADVGVVRIVMIVGMTSMFIAGLVVVELYDDLPGGLYAPIVFVIAYLVARITHAAVFVALSAPQLRRRTLLTVCLTVLPAGVLLTTGALLGSPWLMVLALVTALIEPLVAYRTSAGVDWPVRSTTHFTERHGLIVILALGESTLAIGAGVAAEPMSAAILLGVLLAMAITVGMWWAYFSRLARQAEFALAARRNGDLARAARDGYTYLHLLLVAGIVLAALGIEVAMAHIAESEGLGLFGAAALGGGVACYLSGTALFAHRVIGGWRTIRFVAAGLLVVAVPVLAVMAPVLSLSVVAVLLVALLAVERWAARSSAGT
ncbi:low temperature requirement protein A [soil metagenome]